MAKSGEFRCSKCGRVFAMAAHLGRHTNTMHAPRGRQAPRRLGVSPAGRRAVDGRTRLLGELQACRADLAAQAATISSQLASIDEIMIQLGGVPHPGRVARAPRGRRGVRAGSLRDHIERVLRARRGPVQVRDVTAAVLRAGFKSRDKELSKSVGKCLTSMPGVVKVARGTFRLK